MPSDTAHWEAIYREREPDRLSWFQPAPEDSMALIAESAVPKGGAIIDVGGGASRLAGELVRAGYSDITVADISAAALERARVELGADAERVNWVEADVRSHDFGRRFQLWHDRAAFHFMVEPADRDAYLENLRRSVASGGHAILATFGPQGPTRCSGLPVQRHDAAELGELLGPEFRLVSSRVADHQTPSGVSQQFVYALFERGSTGRPVARQA
jgi:SAM-dependent methyltransferase